MILNFRVENFKSIKEEIVLSFEADRSKDLEDYYILKCGNGKKIRILKFGLIYGANASGKTNILMAIELLRVLVTQPLEKKNDLLYYKPFLFNAVTSKANTKLGIDFIHKGIKYTYYLEFNQTSIVKESLLFHDPNKAIVFNRTTDTLKMISKISFGSKISISKEAKNVLETNTLTNNTVLGGYLKTNIYIEQLENVSDWFNNLLKPIVEPSSPLYPNISGGLDENILDKKIIIELLRKADFDISDIILKKSERHIEKSQIDFLQFITPFPKNIIQEYEKTGKMEVGEILFAHNIDNSKYNLKLEDESAGTIKYYELAGLLNIMIKKSSIIVIDEIESSLHPELLRHFLLSFLVNSNKSQLIATTHYRELLTEKDIFRNDSIWFAEKNEGSSTELYSLADFDSSTIRNTSSVYNAYKIGKLGAVPNIGDYYIDMDDE